MLKILLFIYILIHLSSNQSSIECSEGRVACSNACTDKYFEDYSSYLLAPGLKKNGIGFTDFIKETDILNGGLTIDVDTLKKYLKTQTGAFIFGVAFFFIFSILMAILFFIGSVFIILTKFFPCLCNPNCCPKSNGTCKLLLKTYAMCVGTLMLGMGIALSVNAFKNVSMNEVDNLISDSYHSLDSLPDQLETILPKVIVSLIKQLILPILYGIFATLPNYQTNEILTNTTELLVQLKDIPTIDNIRSDILFPLDELPDERNITNIMATIETINNMKQDQQLDNLIENSSKQCQTYPSIDPNQIDKANDKLLEIVSFPSLFNEMKFGKSGIKEYMSCMGATNDYQNCHDLKDKVDQEIQTIEKRECPSTLIPDECSFQNINHYETKDKCVNDNPIEDHEIYLKDLEITLDNVDMDILRVEINSTYQNILDLFEVDVRSIVENAFNISLFRDMIDNVNNITGSLEILTSQGLQISAINQVIKELDKISSLEEKFEETFDKIDDEYENFDKPAIERERDVNLAHINEFETIRVDLVNQINNAIVEINLLKEDKSVLSNVSCIMTALQPSGNLNDICNKYRRCNDGGNFCNKRSSLYNALKSLKEMLRPLNIDTFERCDNPYTDTNCKISYIGKGVCSTDSSACTPTVGCSTGECSGFIDIRDSIRDFDQLIPDNCEIDPDWNRLSKIAAPLSDIGGFVKYQHNLRSRDVKINIIKDFEVNIKTQFGSLPVFDSPLEKINSIKEDFTTQLDDQLSKFNDTFHKLHNYISDKEPIFVVPGSSQMIVVLNDKLSTYTNTEQFLGYMTDFLESKYKIPLNKLNSLNETKYLNSNVTKYIDDLYTTVAELYSWLFYGHPDDSEGANFLPDIRDDLKILDELQDLFKTDGDDDNRGIQFAGRLATFVLKKEVVTSKDDKGTLFDKEDGTSRDGGMCISQGCLTNTMESYVGNHNFQIGNFGALDIASSVLLLFQIYPIILGILTFITSLLLVFEYKALINCSYATTLLFYFVIGIFFNVICILLLLMYILMTAILSDLPNMMYSAPSLTNITIPFLNTSDLSSLMGNVFSGCNLPSAENPIFKITNHAEEIVLNIATNTIGGVGLGDEMKNECVQIVNNSISSFTGDLTVALDSFTCDPFHQIYSLVIGTLCNALMFIFHFGAIWWMFVIFEANCPIYACTKCVLNSEKKGPEVYTDDKNFSENDQNETVEVPSTVVDERPDDTLNGLKKEFYEAS